MLESHEEVVELVRQVFEENHIPSAHIEVADQIPDTEGDMEAPGQFVHKFNFKWKVFLTPLDGDERTPKEFLIEVDNFENENQIKEYIRQQLQD